MQFMKTKLTTLLLLACFSGYGQQTISLDSDTVYYTTLPQTIDLDKVYVESETYDSDASRYFDAMTTELNDSTKENINDFVVMLKDSLSIDSLAEVFDVMYVFANETQEAALKNVVGRNYDATAVASPTFTVGEGIAGNGSTSYVNTNFNPSSNGYRYSVNSASFGIYSRTDVNGAYIDIGINASSDMAIYSRALSNVAYVRVNSGAWPSTASLDSRGMFIANKTFTTEQDLYRNSSLLIDDTQTNTGLPDDEVFICAWNSGDSPNTPSIRQYSFTFIGKGLTTTQIRQITNCFESYMDHIGKGVIP